MRALIFGRHELDGLDRCGLPVNPQGGLVHRQGWCRTHPDAVLGPLRRPLVAVLAIYVGDRAVAEDLAQEALARAVVDWTGTWQGPTGGAGLPGGVQLARSRTPL